MTDKTRWFRFTKEWLDRADAHAEKLRDCYDELNGSLEAWSSHHGEAATIAALLVLRETLTIQLGQEDADAQLIVRAYANSLCATLGLELLFPELQHRAAELFERDLGVAELPIVDA